MCTPVGDAAAGAVTVMCAAAQCRCCMCYCLCICCFHHVCRCPWLLLLLLPWVLSLLHVLLHVLLPMHVMQYLAVACVTADAMVRMLLHSFGVADACAAAFC